MTPSQLFFDLVHAMEGCRLEAYQDSAGIWTIGYGTTEYFPSGTRVAEGDTCTVEQARTYLAAHIAGLRLPDGLTQAQFDACLDFAYNAGYGAWGSSTLKKNVVAGADGDTITANFLVWDKAHVDGVLTELPGLLRRRKCEAYLFVTGANHPTFFE